MEIELLALDEIKPYEGNPRAHPDRQIEVLKRSIEQFGFTNPILIDSAGLVIAGHGRLEAARRAGLERVPCIRLDQLTPDQARSLRIADNQIALMGGWDDARLREQLEALREARTDFTTLGFDDREIRERLGALRNSNSAPQFRRLADREIRERLGALRNSNSAPQFRRLADDFMVPPLSVIDARATAWAKRKREWRGFIATTTAQIGRQSRLVRASGLQHANFYRRKQALEQALGRDFSFSDFSDYLHRLPTSPVQSGTSQFDPALSELMYAWYCPPRGSVLDPFAGDVERGIVAGVIGLPYVGIELRTEQQEANTAIAALLAEHLDPQPTWIAGDSLERLNDPEFRTHNGAADFLFSCPPYWKLESYDGGEDDLSSVTLAEFTRRHSAIIAGAVERLKDDRFAVWVIGNFYDPDARAVVPLTEITRAGFAAAGMRLHAEFLFLTPIGVRALRSRGLFTKFRRVPSVHETVLVFVKGDARAAAEAAGEVRMAELPEVEAEPEESSDE